MLVVSDTTPIISLLKVKRIDVLEFLFGEVYIPNAVYKELTSNQLFIEEAEKIKNSAFIKTVNIPMDDSLNMLRRATGLEYKHPTKKGKVTVPIHPGKDISRKTEESILKQAGLR